MSTGYSKDQYKTLDSYPKGTMFIGGSCIICGFKIFTPISSSMLHNGSVFINKEIAQLPLLNMALARFDPKDCEKEGEAKHISGHSHLVCAWCADDVKNEYLKSLESRISEASEKPNA